MPAAEGPSGGSEAPAAIVSASASGALVLLLLTNKSLWLLLPGVLRRPFSSLQVLFLLAVSRSSK